MSAAVWNEPQDPESRYRRYREVHRAAGASWSNDWNTSALMICAPRRAAEPEGRYAAGPRPAETTA
jgi:hypothetical protein